MLKNGNLQDMEKPMFTKYSLIILMVMLKFLEDIN